MAKITLEVEAQGDHSTPVNTAELKTFMEEAISERVEVVLEDKNACGLNGPVIAQMLSIGTWRFNVERRRMPGSCHYHAGTIRAYPAQASINGLRLVAHPKGGERRYGHLHAPAEIRLEQRAALLDGLLLMFNPLLAACVEQEQSEIARERSEFNVEVRDLKQELRGRRGTIDATSKMLDRLRTIFRSHEKKRSLTELWLKQVGSAEAEVDLEQLNKLFEGQWCMHRGDQGLRATELVLDSMLYESTVLGLIVQVGENLFTLGEYGNFLWEECSHEAFLQQRAGRAKQRKALSVEIEQLQKKEKELLDRLECTRAEIREKREHFGKLIEADEVVSATF